jgi:hypothetical protein
MKSSLTYLFLLSGVGLTGAAAAETIGVAIASPLAYVLPFCLFLGSSLLLILGTDYNRNSLRLDTLVARPTLLPANEAFYGADAAAIRPMTPRTDRALTLAHH